MVEMTVQRGDKEDEDYVKITLSRATSREKLTLLFDRFRMISGVKEIRYYSDKGSRG